MILPKWSTGVMLVVLGMLITALAIIGWKTWPADRTTIHIPKSETQWEFSYGINSSLAEDHHVFYTIYGTAQPVDEKLETKREFNIAAGSFRQQLGDLIWMSDIPTMAAIYTKDLRMGKAITGVFTMGAALDTLLQDAGCAREVVNHEVLKVYCGINYTLIRASAAQQAEISMFGMHDDTRLIGNAYYARQFPDARVNKEDHRVFIPRGDAAETLPALQRIQGHMQEALPYELKIAKDLAGHQTQEVDGVFSATEALNQMLIGSGLEQHHGNNWLAVVAPKKAVVSAGL